MKLQCSDTLDRGGLRRCWCPEGAQRIHYHPTHPQLCPRRHIQKRSRKVSLCLSSSPLFLCYRRTQTDMADTVLLPAGNLGTLQWLQPWWKLHQTFAPCTSYPKGRPWPCGQPKGSCPVNLQMLLILMVLSGKQKNFNRNCYIYGFIVFISMWILHQYITEFSVSHCAIIFRAPTANGSWRRAIPSHLLPLEHMKPHVRERPPFAASMSPSVGHLQHESIDLTHHRLPKTSLGSRDFADESHFQGGLNFHSGSDFSVIQESVPHNSEYSGESSPNVRILPLIQEGLRNFMMFSSFWVQNPSLACAVEARLGAWDETTEARAEADYGYVQQCLQRSNHGQTKGERFVYSRQISSF